jgi:hypothetical protein
MNQAVVFEYQDGTRSAPIPTDVASTRGLHDCPNHLVSPEGVPECVGTTVTQGFRTATHKAPDVWEGHRQESPTNSLLVSDQPMAGGFNPLVAVIAVAVLGVGCTLITRFGGRVKR